MKIRSAKIQRQTRKEWEEANPVLYDGTLVYETDTERFKLGDGVKSYTELDYHVDPHVSLLCSEILFKSRMRDAIQIISFIITIVIWGLLSLMNCIGELKFIWQFLGCGFIYFICSLFFNNLLTRKRNE